MFTVEQYVEAKRLGKPNTGKAGAPLTITNYAFSLRRAEALLGKPLAEMGPGDDERLLEAMDAAGFSPATKNKILAPLRQAFRWAIATRRYRGTNPFETVGSFEVHPEVPLILTREEVDGLLDLMDRRWPKYGLFFRLMAYCGLRIREVTTIKRSDVLADGLVVRGKGNKQRVVPLPASLKARLGQHMREDDGAVYLFEGYTEGEPITVHHPTDVFKRAVLAAGLNPDLTPHNLRHTSATLFHEATGDLAMTQKYLGHASPHTTVRYAQIADSRLKAAHAKVFE